MSIDSNNIMDYGVVFVAAVVVLILGALFTVIAARSAVVVQDNYDIEDVGVKTELLTAYYNTTEVLDYVPLSGHVTIAIVGS